MIIFATMIVFAWLVGYALTNCPEESDEAEQDEWGMLK
jgi:hypothetical protein